MANATVSQLGQVNASGDANALFLKVFSGEVLATFMRENKMLGMTSVRSISSGKSATFPVIGTTSAAYHTPGAEITGTQVKHNEKVISIDDLLLSSAFLSNIEEAKNHYDVKFCVVIW
uniref:Capsid protein n=1 Tax=uncultured Alphaproteobacteria bacterium TaxID=91750 RepID=A0A1B0Z2V4_9PROT|nr:capsid protein [uncultured Alphaproteobacteria bacterium]